MFAFGCYLRSLNQQFRWSGTTWSLAQPWATRLRYNGKSYQQNTGMSADLSVFCFWISQRTLKKPLRPLLLNNAEGSRDDDKLSLVTGHPTTQQNTTCTP
eukprot:EG_transcript_35144